MVPFRWLSCSSGFLLLASCSGSVQPVSLGSGLSQDGGNSSSNGDTGSDSGLGGDGAGPCQNLPYTLAERVCPISPGNPQGLPEMVCEVDAGAPKWAQVCPPTPCDSVPMDLVGLVCPGNLVQDVCLDDGGVPYWTEQCMLGSGSCTGTACPEMVDGSGPQNPSDGGNPQPPACTPTPVNFVMQSASVDAGYSYSFSLGIPGDGVWWYSLAQADGGPLSIFPSETTCDACGLTAIAVGAACGALPDGGATATWDGALVTGNSMCSWSPGGGEPAESISCNTTECAPPGRYIVTMCATKNVACPTPNGNVCIDVPFDYPTTSDVVGTLP